MIKFIESDSMKISVHKEQEKFLSNKNKIENAIKGNDVLAFDIFDDNLLIGFVMLKEFQKGCFFLWDYAIDYKYQNKGYGINALKELINLLREEHNMKVMTTTYTWGNDHAKHIYEKIGFVETDVVCNDECHEVNMIYRV